MEVTSVRCPFGAWAELIASGLITGGIYALVALGLNLQYGLMRILNIAHGEFLMLGAYLTWLGADLARHLTAGHAAGSFAPLMALGLAIYPLPSGGWRAIPRTSTSSRRAA